MKRIQEERNMRKKKQITALALAMGLAVTGSTAAYGAVGDPAVGVDTATVSTTGPTETELLGRINATTLKVTIPLNVTFDVDPSKYDKNETDFLTRQMNGPNNYNIVNNSATPVYVHISNIAQGTVAGDITSTCVLTDDPADVENTAKKKQVLMAIRDKTDTKVPATYADLSTGFGFKPGTNNYTLNKDNKGKIESGATMTLTIYGLTNKGWTQGDVFSVKPSFTVGLTPII